MLKLPAVVTREIDGFLPAADAVKRGLVAKESPEPVGTVGQPLGGVGPKGRAFVRSIDVENQTMSLKAVGGSGTTKKTPWAQVSGKIEI